MSSPLLPFRNFVIGTAVVGGLRLRDAQSRIVGIAQEFTESNLQLAKSVRSGTLDKVARRCAVPADNGSLASMGVRGLTIKAGRELPTQWARTAAAPLSRLLPPPCRHSCRLRYQHCCRPRCQTCCYPRCRTCYCPPCRHCCGPSCGTWSCPRCQTCCYPPLMLLLSRRRTRSYFRCWTC